MTRDRIFIGYPAEPRRQSDVIRAAESQLRIKRPDIDFVLWEKMQVDGRVIVSEILHEIDLATMCMFDVTSLSENILFECGYAIAKGKNVWLTLDSTLQYSKPNWKEFGLLAPVGYTAYQNSEDLVSKFLSISPQSRESTTYDDLIEPILDDDIRKESLLYCLTFEPFEAANRLTRLVDDRRRRGLGLIVSDPKESGLEQITWYAPSIQKSAGVLVHFAGDNRNRAKLYNRRYAFVSGMALGLDVPVLMLAEDDYTVPFDYETELRKYGSAEECLAIARRWLDDLHVEEIRWSPPRESRRSALAGLRFGEHVAENEAGELADYFVETAAFSEVIASRDTIFVGHRGTGKTANAIYAYDTLTANKTNLTVMIKPPGFEFAALLAIIDRLPDFQHDYFFDALWRFIIQTEIGAAVARNLEERAPSVPLDMIEAEFMEYVNNAHFDMRAEITERLEQALDQLLHAIPEELRTDGSNRNLINEAFHANAMVELRRILGQVLRGKQRVAVFVDNLDKGWERGRDFKVLARLILGLLTARGRLVVDFQKDDHWRKSIKLTMSVFLRSDIYNYLRNEAREPDKLPISTIAWNDQETLLSVLESRFMFARSNVNDPTALWSTYFCSDVCGIPIREYVASTILPRPRDLVYFFNTAVAQAIDRRHSTVEEVDMISAAEAYSQYAYEALLVENGVTVPEIENSLLGFLGAPTMLDYGEAVAMIEATTPGAGEKIFSKLVEMSFFGIEVSDGKFEYPEVGTKMKRALARAGQLTAKSGRRRVCVHSAFRRFFDMR